MHLIFIQYFQNTLLDFLLFFSLNHRTWFSCLHWLHCSTGKQLNNYEFGILNNFETISSFPFRTLSDYFFIIHPNYLYFLFILSAFVESMREISLDRCHVYSILSRT